MNAVGYLRELSDPGPGLTLEAQHRAYLDACERLGLSIGATYTDLDGAPPEGVDEAPDPELRRMLRRLMLDGQHRFTTVVAASPRVLGESARARIRRMLQFAALGLPLAFADGTPADRALLDEWAARAPQERRRERAIEGMRRRALRGEVLGRSPYGYRIAGRRLEPDDVEAPVVRRIFRLYLEDGEGVRRIAGRLNADGLRTRRGGPWSMVTVRDLLRNPVYTGTYRRLGVTIPKAHDPLVTRDDFESVQRKMAARRTSGGPQERREYLLAGLAFCGHCGNHLVGMTRRRTAEEGGEHRYYQCQSMTNQSRCGYHTRRAAELEAAVHAALLEDRVSLRPLLTEAPAGGDVDETRRQAMQRDLDRMLERRALGQWTPEQLRTHAGPLVLAQLAAEERASAGSEPGAGPDAPAGEARRRLVREWERLPASERRALLLQVVSEVVVTGEDVRVAVAL